MASTERIEDLPREMLAEILSYVSIEDLIYSVQYVCIQWKLVSQDTHVWTDRIYSPEYDQSDTEIASVLEQTPKLRTLIINQRTVGSDLTTAVVQHCPNLKKLMFNDNQMLSVPILKSLVEKCPNIESFTVPYPVSCSPEKVEIMGRFSHLKDLCFAGCDMGIYLIKLKPIADGCPSLQSIDLKYMMHSHDDLVYFLQKKKDQLHTLAVRWCSVDLKCSTFPIALCTVLISLHLYCYWDIGKEIEEGFLALRSLSSITCLTLSRLNEANIDDVVSVFENNCMKRLVQLRIIEYDNYEDKLANVIVNNCPWLKLLFLEYCSELCDQSMENFHLLPELESISLRGSDLNCVVSLSKCINLKYLNLMNCLEFRDSSLELITDYSNLEVLILDGCNIKALPMHLFSTSLTRLALLSINNCRNVNKEALVQLKAGRPHLLVHDQNIMGCVSEEENSNTEPEGEVQSIEDEDQDFLLEAAAAV